MIENQIKAAVEHYETLLRKQLARVEDMEKGTQAADLSKKEKIVIGVIGGDGIGPIIVEQAKRVLDILLKDEIATGRVEIREIGGLTIENRLALGQSVPEETLAEIKKCDVLLKGPTTTPKGGTFMQTCVPFQFLKRVLIGHSTVKTQRVNMFSAAAVLKFPANLRWISRSQPTSEHAE